MVRLFDSGSYAVQKQSVMHSKEFHEGEFDQGEAQWGGWHDMLGDIRPLPFLGNIIFGLKCHKM